jgi:preprotein translocase SecE subunit
VQRYSIIVIITVAIYTAFIGGLDYLMSLISGWFYG